MSYTIIWFIAYFVTSLAADPHVDITPHLNTWAIMLVFAIVFDVAIELKKHEAK